MLETAEKLLMEVHGFRISLPKGSMKADMLMFEWDIKRFIKEVKAWESDQTDTIH